MIVKSTKDIGAAIRKIRSMRGINQVELAGKVGKHQSLISRVENGGETEFSTIFELLQVLRVDISFIPLDDVVEPQTAPAAEADTVLDGSEAVEGASLMQAASAA